MEAAYSFGADPADGVRIEIISVILAQISVPVSSGFGTLISADETLIKSNHEKAHGFMKAEIYKDEGYQLMGGAFEVYNDRG